MWFERREQCCCCGKILYKRLNGDFVNFAYHKVDEKKWKRLNIDIELENKSVSNVLGYICPDCLDKYKITIENFV